MTVRAALVALVVVLLTTASGPIASARGPIGECKVKGGGSPHGTPWPQQRLTFLDTWSITRGAGVLVAVIDSGLDTTHPQLRGMNVEPGVNVTSAGSATDTRDCYGHGTSVTAIIGAQPSDTVAFRGVAPDAKILPIKQTAGRSDQANGSDSIGRAIDAAIAAKADVVNVSVAVANPTPLLQGAVARARTAGLIIVAAAGNEGQGTNLPAYPAAYSPRFANVIAVSASTQTDEIARFSDRGDYVNVAAPGEKVELPAELRGYVTVSGTSFAAPYVTGTVALILASHRGITPSEVRNRLEATADPPPANGQDRRYGYGIINPLLAVTAIRDDSALPTRPSAATEPLPPRAASRPPDEHLQHLALALSAALLGLCVLAVAAAIVLRGQHRRPAASRRDLDRRQPVA